MSRLSNIVKLRIFRRNEKLNSLMRRTRHRLDHPRPVAHNDNNITPKRAAAREKRGDTLGS